MAGRGSFPRSPSSSYFDDDDDEPFELPPAATAGVSDKANATEPVSARASCELSNAPHAVSTRVSSSVSSKSVSSAPGGANGSSETQNHYSRSSDRARPRRPDRDRRVPAARDQGEATPTSNSSKPPRSLKARALGYLSRREHSRSELARKLSPYVETTDDADTPADVLGKLFDDLSRDGWLSESRFADSVVNRRASRFGASRIVGELKRHGVDASLVQSHSAVLRESEWARICSVWQRKFGVVASDHAGRAKQARFLAARGFSPDLITKIVKAGDDALSEFDTSDGDI